MGRDTKTAFLPDEPSPDAVQEEWTDTPDTAGSSWEHADSGIPSQSSTEEKLEDYPKVTEESEQEVVRPTNQQTARMAMQEIERAVTRKPLDFKNFFM